MVYCFQPSGVKVIGGVVGVVTEIDKLVYELYEPTDEEIIIVEGSFS